MASALPIGVKEWAGAAGPGHGLGMAAANILTPGASVNEISEKKRKQMLETGSNLNTVGTLAGGALGAGLGAYLGGGDTLGSDIWNSVGGAGVGSTVGGLSLPALHGAWTAHKELGNIAENKAEPIREANERAERKAMRTDPKFAEFWATELKQASYGIVPQMAIQEGLATPFIKRTAENMNTPEALNPDHHMEGRSIGKALGTIGGGIAGGVLGHDAGEGLGSALGGSDLTNAATGAAGAGVGVVAGGVTGNALGRVTGSTVGSFVPGKPQPHPLRKLSSLANADVDTNGLRTRLGYHRWLAKKRSTPTDVAHNG